MREYKIAIIDDREDEIRALKLKLGKFTIIKMVLADELNDLVDDIFTQKLDGVIVDFDLTGTNSKVHYQGDQVYKRIREQKKHYPVTVLTAFSADAESTTIDPDIVYEKSKVFEDWEEFSRKLEKKIDQYRDMLTEAKKEYIKLLRQENLTYAEEERIIELDTLIEDELQAEYAMYPSIKSTSNQKKLNELINLTEKLIERLEK